MEALLPQTSTREPHSFRCLVMKMYHLFPVTGGGVLFVDAVDLYLLAISAVVLLWVLLGIVAREDSNTRHGIDLVLALGSGHEPRAFKHCIV